MISVRRSHRVFARSSCEKKCRPVLGPRDILTLSTPISAHIYTPESIGRDSRLFIVRKKRSWTESAREKETRMIRWSVVLVVVVVVLAERGFDARGVFSRAVVTRVLERVWHDGSRFEGQK